MTSTSAGSRPEPKEFLKGKLRELYAQAVEQGIRDLQDARTPGVGDQAMTGAVPDTIRAKYEGGSLRV